MNTSEDAHQNWDAQWIWGDDRGEPSAYAYFRKTFRLVGVEPAQIRISADTRYELFINAVFAGRGAPSEESSCQHYDTHDVSDLLRPRENVITVVVNHVGTTHGRRGGLLLELRTQSNETLGTDDTWRAQRATAWQTQAASSCEFFDARVDPPEWHDKEFDDSAWPRATALKSAHPRVWSHLVACERPPPPEIPTLPLAVIQISECPAGEEESPHDLVPPLSQPGQAIRHCTATNVDALTIGKGAASFASGNAHAPRIALDFGSVLTARLSFSAIAHDGATIDVGYADALDGGALSLTGADRLTLREGEQTLAPFGARTFRYITLRFAECPDSLVLKRVLAMASTP